MKIQYIHKRFQSKRLNIITKANEIIKTYQEAGYDLTLRQLYYQFIAKDLLPNTQKSYMLLSNTISDARLAGMIDWYSIVDRTRNPKENSHWKNPSEIIRSCAQQFEIDKRKTQPEYIEVWVEKEALAGVIQRTCEDLDILSFACRGYVSSSAMWRAAERIKRRTTINTEIKHTTILHLGDHDPSGMHMTEDIQSRLDMFRGSHLFVDVKRIALNMDQIEEYKPPPNFAKLADTRAANYISKYGTSSWELDALDPQTIDGLIRHHVRELTDGYLWHKSVDLEKQHRQQLQKIANNLGE